MTPQDEIKKILERANTHDEIVYMGVRIVSCPSHGPALPGSSCGKCEEILAQEREVRRLCKALLVALDGLKNSCAADCCGVGSRYTCAACEIYEKVIKELRGDLSNTKQKEE